MIKLFFLIVANVNSFIQLLLLVEALNVSASIFRHGFSSFDLMPLFLELLSNSDTVKAIFYSSLPTQGVNETLLSPVVLFVCFILAIVY